MSYWPQWDLRILVNSEDFERFNKVYNVSRQELATSIRLEEVSTLVGLTPTAFCRYFKERTKKTFVEYLNEMRIGYSKKPITGKQNEDFYYQWGSRIP